MQKTTAKQLISKAGSILWKDKTLLFLTWLLWGTSFLKYIPPFGEFIILFRLLEPVFYGRAAESACQAVKQKTPLFKHFRSNVINVLIITFTVYAPLFIILTLVGLLFGIEHANLIFFLLAYGIPMVPAIVIIWNSILKKSSLLNAIGGGLLKLQGHFVLSIALGLLNQGFILIYNEFERFMFTEGTILIALLFGVLMAIIQGVFRLYLLVLLYPEYLPSNQNRTTLTPRRFRK
jgi:hypothetical protein